MKKHTAEMFAVEYRAGKEIRGLTLDVLRRDEKQAWIFLRRMNPGSSDEALRKYFRVVKVRIEWESR